MAFRDINDVNAAEAYIASLDQRWPERVAVRKHLSSQLRTSPGNHAPGLHVIELCAGAGVLAEQLFADHPQIRYTGIDITAPLLELATTRLAEQASRSTWLEADLNQNGWIERIKKPVHAVVSLQSLHDLGDEAAVSRIFQLTAQLLAPQGQLIYADMLAAEPPPENNTENTNPGKLSVERHLELLRAAGFVNAACTLKTNVFGCFVAEIG